MGIQGIMLPGQGTTEAQLRTWTYWQISYLRRASVALKPCFSCLDGYLNEKGTVQGWNNYLKDLQQLTEAGSSTINWDTDKVLVLKIFRGSTLAGPWTMLMIVDRTKKDNPLAVFADSLPAPIWPRNKPFFTMVTVAYTPCVLRVH
jgi:hypothetical protein